MATEIRVPTLGESISEATVGKWFKQRGDAVKADEPLVELETEKVTLEVNAPGAGVLSEIVVQTGETVSIGALLGALSRRGAPPRRRRPRQSRGEPRPPPSPRARDRDAARAVGGENRAPRTASTSAPSPAAASAARC